MTDTQKRYLDWKIERELLNAKYKDEEYDISIELAYVAYNYGLNEYYNSLGLKHHPITEDKITNALRLAQEFWIYICDKVKEINPDMKPKYAGMLSLVQIWVNNSSNENAAQLILITLLGKAIPIVMNNYKEYLIKDFEEIDNLVPKFKTFTDEEIDQLIGDADDHVVQEFFKLFEEIKVFHINPEDYATDEEREKHNRMLALFTKICGYK